MTAQMANEKKSYAYLKTVLFCSLSILITKDINLVNVNRAKEIFQSTAEIKRNFYISTAELKKESYLRNKNMYHVETHV